MITPPRKSLKLAGRTFGRLTVDTFAGISQDKYQKSLWNCTCECGAKIVWPGAQLNRGKKRSCGCAERERIKLQNITHGMSYSSEYTVWRGMIARCTYPSHKSFHRYGGRGITICDRWRNSFENYFADMGPRPSLQHSIERRDTNGNYEPNNCYWATNKEQSRNRRSTLWIEFNGALTQVIDIYERTEHRVSYEVFRGRIKRLGWCVEDALSKPLDPRGGQNKKYSKEINDGVAA